MVCLPDVIGDELDQGPGQVVLGNRSFGAGLAENRLALWIGQGVQYDVVTATPKRSNRSLHIFRLVLKVVVDLPK